VNRQDQETIDYLSSQKVAQVQVVLEDNKKPDLTYFMNLAYRETKWPADIFCYIGDDFISLTKDWDVIVEKDLEDTHNCCLISGPDSYLGNPGCPTYFFIHKKLIDAMSMGEFVCHLFPLEGTDKAMGDILDPLQLVIWDEDLIFDHRHASKYGTDDTFNRLATSWSEHPGYGREFWNYIRRAQQNIMKNLKF
jgi:hypothetical protein